MRTLFVGSARHSIKSPFRTYRGETVQVDCYALKSPYGTYIPFSTEFWTEDSMVVYWQPFCAEAFLSYFTVPFPLRDVISSCIYEAFLTDLFVVISLG